MKSLARTGGSLTRAGCLRRRLSGARCPKVKFLRVGYVYPLAAEHQSNFGFNLSAWDRLFGTYKAQPDAGHEAMTIGLGEFQSAHPTRLWWSLALPARRP